ncbi:MULTISPECIES: NAD-dependent succinate-semialdehyde dehydrogenase [Erwinia]|uniref:Succinate-semialdehyde dehydrogenase n=1 Tax=Erwinia rhapontici TaxID=55212 RepID=A0ABN6DHI1_ERWRD|nr:NAD-dependent succinate-semialdehyde dehydrogenase [Erwinia rhapontici]MCS3605257.1 succinate-semialdehyde dehydrogenase/glutarate-semialdehyde dehydrogenase [Erwinia rhapontici]NKG32893.1 NAD-dependent succinate-semialdehyde dehydrogenase [Erwinia rhapontici]TDT01357.1 succinate-semialdehyde dehydrogenase/glutarate-semialdehyde dehydrogenase [Erwinia rhapontici]UDQ81732.1 NAD-dependent succinate-semialdehyde dehydrogenase [Erwinia rhapontici]BCQ34191.1 succinate-semialdehyde dehydrogenase 
MPYQTINPASNKLIKSWPDHSDSQIEQALATADALYHSDWSKGDLQPRVQVLKKLADLIDSRVDELAEAASIEMGKLIEQSRGEVQLCAQIARYYAENAGRFLAPTPYPSELGEAWVENHPIGVLVAVEPWNFPFYQLMRVLAPNLAAGNPVLAKHAQNVPHCAVLFEALVTEAGAPAGAWTNIFASNDQVAALIADDRVQGAALTGSERAGSAVAQQAGKYLKKTTLELGGNDVFVVLDDSDLEKAVKAGVGARLSNCGQVCTAAKRFLVHEKVADRFLEKMTEAFKAVKIGDPLDASTTLGPLSSAEARDRLHKQVQQAKEKGANVLLGGAPVPGDGCFYQPTILTGITRDNPAYFEEFFGPVAQIYVVKNDDDVVKLANDSHYGLGGAVFTKDIARGKALASRIETGMVYINSSSNTAAELPFGGVKRSGYGRELSDLGIKEFVNQKLVVISKD